MKKINILLLSVLFLTSFTLISCSDDDDKGQPKSNTIVDVAKGNPQFSTLVKALTITGLDKALDNKAASFTVFAPTDAAFASLLTELKFKSLNDIPKETLSNILLYHVLDGSKMAASIQSGYYPTLSKGPADTKLSLNVDMGKTMINNRAKITATDVKADNGVVHVIDKVIMPQSIVDFAVNNPTFSILVQALTKADLVGTLSGNGPFTVFAPTDDAFKALFKAAGVTGINDLSKEALTPILLAHVVNGNVTSSQLTNGQQVQTLNTTKKITVSTTDGVKLDGTIKVVLPNVQGSNGIIHVIDKVIALPAK